MFKILACFNQKRALGKDGKLLFHIGNDLSNFKKATLNNVVIMGRMTFETLPNGKPLSDRVNIVITSNKDYCIDNAFDNVFIVHSVEEAVELCDAFFSDKELFVIGGESIYREFLDMGLVDELRLTLVKDNEDGDVFFPQINEDEWYEYYKSMVQVSSYGGLDKSFYYQILKKKK